MTDNAPEAAAMCSNDFSLSGSFSVERFESN